MQKYATSNTDMAHRKQISQDVKDLQIDSQIKTKVKGIYGKYSVS